MTTTRNFLGIPVEGDITEGDKRADQRPIEELQPLLQAVLDESTITEFGWSQYTPYFNDGDACTFSVHSLWVRTDADTDAELYDLDVDYGHPTLGKRPAAYNRETNAREYGAYEGPDEARHDRCHALDKAIQSGEFDDVLLDAFGDHAQVTVRRDGIQVDSYEHD